MLLNLLLTCNISTRPLCVAHVGFKLLSFIRTVTKTATQQEVSENTPCKQQQTCKKVKITTKI